MDAPLTLLLQDCTFHENQGPDVSVPQGAAPAWAPPPPPPLSGGGWARFANRVDGADAAPLLRLDDPEFQALADVRVPFTLCMSRGATLRFERWRRGLYASSTLAVHATPLQNSNRIVTHMLARRLATTQ